MIGRKTTKNQLITTIFESSIQFSSFTHKFYFFLSFYQEAVAVVCATQIEQSTKKIEMHQLKLHEPPSVRKLWREIK